MKINTALIASYTNAIQRDKLDTLVADAEASMASHTKDLPQFINEFCYAFNLRVTGSSGRQVFVATPNGLPVGRLYIGETGPRYGAKERVFAFKSDIIIHRERSLPGTYDNDIRHAKTTRGMLQTLKKNDKPINEATVAAYYTSGMELAIATPYDDCRHTRAPIVEVPTYCLLSMVEAALGIDPYSVQRHKDILRDTYDKYLSKNANRLAAEVVAQRFGRGCHVIGHSSAGAGFFYVAQAKLVADAATGKVELGNYPKAELTTPLVRVESLPEEFCGLAAITKAYMQSRPNDTSDANPFGIKMGTDTYFEDVDIVASYTQRMQWIIIPMEKDHA